MIIYKTERLLIESWDYKDFDAFAVIARNPDVMHYIGDGKLWDDSRIKAFIKLQKTNQTALGYCNWKLINRDNGELIGFCGLAPLPIAEATEVGWWLKPDYWGQGLAIEAAEHVLNAAFDTHCLIKVVARAYAANKRSIGLMKRLGMTYSHCLNRTIVGDVLLYSIEAKGSFE